MCARASANHQFCPALSQTSSGFGFILSTSVGLSLARKKEPRFDIQSPCFHELSGNEKRQAKN